MNLKVAHRKESDYETTNNVIKDLRMGYVS